MLFALLSASAIFSAIQAIRSKRLIEAAIYLAGVSTMVALIFYLLGAHEVAVIELSVGAGLVTVLFVFAISLAGDEPISFLPNFPKPLGFILALIPVTIIGLQLFSLVGVSMPFIESSFSEILWQERGPDVLVQVVLIFCGVLGMLGILSVTAVSAKKTSGLPIANPPNPAKSIDHVEAKENQ